MHRVDSTPDRAPRHKSRPDTSLPLSSCGRVSLTPQPLFPPWADTPRGLRRASSSSPRHSPSSLRGTGGEGHPSTQDGDLKRRYHLSPGLTSAPLSFGVRPRFGPPTHPRSFGVHLYPGRSQHAPDDRGPLPGGRDPSLCRPGAHPGSRRRGHHGPPPCPVTPSNVWGPRRPYNTSRDGPEDTSQVPGVRPHTSSGSVSGVTPDPAPAPRVCLPGA